MRRSDTRRLTIEQEIPVTGELVHEERHIQLPQEIPHTHTMDINASPILGTRSTRPMNRKKYRVTVRDAPHTDEEESSSESEMSLADEDQGKDSDLESTTQISYRSIDLTDCSLPPTQEKPIELKPEQQQEIQPAQHPIPHETEDTCDDRKQITEFPQPIPFQTAPTPSTSEAFSLSS